MSIAEELFKKHWKKRTGSELTGVELDHMSYCIDAIQEGIDTYKTKVTAESYASDIFEYISTNEEETPAEDMIEHIKEEIMSDFGFEEEEDDECYECRGTGISSCARVDDSCSTCGGSGIKKQFQDV